MTVTRVILPKLGLTMDEGRLVAWHKSEGDTVAEGDVLFEVETDKATMEVPASTGGIVRKLLAAVDDVVPVATVVALIADTATESLEGQVESAPSGSSGAGAFATVADSTFSAHEPPSASRPGAATTPTSPSASPPSSSSPAPSSASSDRLLVSPAARRRASELGVDLASLHGSGPGGRIQIEDVEQSAGAGTVGVGERRVPLTRMRKAIGQAMTKSVREAPQFALSRDVDMTAANEARKKAGASYTDIIVSAAARALRDHERLRARLDGDAIVISGTVHIGIAVALDDGLIVPVLRDADTKDLATIALERAALEQGAKAGKLPADALTGATLSVSNLGTLGVDRFQAIVNPPEAAILAVGRVSDRVVARDGVPAVRPIATFTLSVDHRVADGADAARYLSAFADLLERGG